MSTRTRPPSFPWILLALPALALALCGCGDKLGASCDVGGALDESVAYLPAADECDGVTCLFLDGYGSFCTDHCAGDGDCPNGYECADVDLIPSAVEQIEPFCIPEEPLGDDDDDDTTPFGVPPVISDLTIWSASDPDSGACWIWHRFTWHDDDGDLSGAVARIEFRDPAGAAEPIKYKTTLEMLDTTDTELTFHLDHDGSNLGFSTTYNVYVEIEDRAGNDSNELAEGGYTTPNANCE